MYALFSQKPPTCRRILVMGGRGSRGVAPREMMHIWQLTQSKLPFLLALTVIS
jgi:hypothetical protein